MEKKKSGGFALRWHRQPAIPAYAKERVARGAARLDAVNPDWYLKVEPKKINLASGYDCILGQVYGNYLKGALVVFTAEECDAPKMNAVWLGFDVADSSEADTLTAAWRAEIRSRKAADAAARAP